MADLDQIEGALTSAFASEFGQFGGQYFLRLSNDTRTAAVGEAQPGSRIHDATPFNLYCAGKPIAILAALGALEAADVDCGPDAALSDLLRVPGPSTPMTLGNLLSHRAGLGSPGLFDFLNASEARRFAMMPTPGQLSSVQPGFAYSSVAAMGIVSTIVRKQLDTTLTKLVDDVAREHQLTSVFVRRAEPGAVGTYVDVLDERSWPLLHDQLPFYYDAPSSELVGAYSSARDLGSWCSLLLQVVRGHRPLAGFPTRELFARHLTQGDLVSSDDGSPAYACGVARRLDGHGLRVSSPSAMGHFGFVRSSLFYIDPECDLVLACVVRDLRMHDLESRLHQWNDVLAVVND